jgi:hypothetical protein
MQIKFTAQTMPEYRGLNGKGEHISLKSGDICDVTEEVAKLLLKHYKKDFEVAITEKPVHAPKKDKQLKKTAKFKSK